jgi:hypothetical protein
MISGFIGSSALPVNFLRVRQSPSSLPKFQLTPEKPVEKYSDGAATSNVRKWGDDGKV